jgi:hypothetical protein
VEYDGGRPLSSAPVITNVGASMLVQSIDHAGGPDQYRSHGTRQADGVEVVDGAGELVG